MMENQIGTNQNPASTEPTQVSEVQGAQFRQAQCAVCMASFSSPIKVLHCGHSFCYECTLGVWRSSINRAFMECPLCRQPTPVPNRNPTRLPNNFGMMDLLGIPAVDTTNPELDKTMSEAESSAYSRGPMAPHHSSVSSSSNSHVPSLYDPPTIPTVSSMFVEDFGHVQNLLEDFQIPSLFLEDFEGEPGPLEGND